MATIVKSIGSGKDYASVSAWEADLDNAAIYSAGDTARGEVYGALSMPNLTINGGGTIGLAAVVLTGAPSNRHTGIAGTGAKLVCNTVAFSGSLLTIVPTASMTMEVSWLELDLNDLAVAGIVNLGGYNTEPASIHHNIIHNNTRTVSAAVVGIQSTGSRRTKIYGNIIYDLENTNSSGVVGIDCSSTFESVCHNNTVHDLRCTAGTGTAIGIKCVDDADVAYKNNIVTGITAPTPSCFSPSSFSLAAASNNISSDATAPGTSSQTGISAASLFVDPLAYDLHLKAGAVAIDTGINLGSPYDTDIDGQSRGILFDVGADEYVAVVTGGPFPHYIRRSLAGGMSFPRGGLF